MTDPEFAKWYESSTRELAAVNAAAGNWPPGEALEMARKSRRALLPDGRTTAGMLFLQGLRPDRTVAGFLWIGLAHPRGTPDCAYLFYLEVAEALRGAGYGRALLAAGEEIVRSHGIGALELNVFGANTAAVGLYATSGYHVVTQQMRKPLAGHSSDFTTHD